MAEKPILSLPVKRQSSFDIEENANKPMCKYGEKCYRKNPQHFKEFQHSKCMLLYFNSKIKDSGYLETIIQPLTDYLYNIIIENTY